jgi:hypothetical protein
MPILQSGPFPVLQDILDLARSYVNDMYPGVGGTNGRILTNSAPFTLPYLNSAFRTVQRKLRNEGVTYPIKDNVQLLNITPVQQVNPNVQVSIGYNGYFDGTQNHPTPVLPADCVQPLVLWEQIVGSGLPFQLMCQSQEGLTSIFQGPLFGYWEWRTYQLNMPGSQSTENLRMRYTVGQPPFASLPTDFATTQVFIIDSQEALACDVALQYGRARGASPDAITSVQAQRDAAIDDMAQEWVRRAQTVTYRRMPYGGPNGGDSSNNAGGYGGGLI